MAIIVDPDNLDRRQVIFGSENQLISLRDVGNPVYVDGYDVTDGYAVPGALQFESETSTFQTDSVAAGDILCILNTEDAAHYVIDSVDSETQLTVLADGTDFTAFTGSDGYSIFDVRDPTGGSIADGVTEQAVYSFGKEEWKTDGRVAVLSDDLIRHPFPLEAITREQMENGGGTSHEDWSWFNGYTRKKVRTGGWADKNTGGTTLEEWTGIITLGTLDADTQVYYQLTNVSTAPTDFTFLGAVNEPIKVFEDGGADNRAFLKLFARKKAKTYDGSEISDIGVTTIETIVNRFPLAHTDDAAISATDGQILGIAPYRTTVAITNDTDGSKTINEFTFTSVTDFSATTPPVVAGDTLRITSGSDQGYYTISNVATTTLTIAPDFEFSGWTSTENTLAWTVYTGEMIAAETDGVIEDVDSDTGTLDSATGGFTAAGIAADDLVIISSDGYDGVYKVISNDSDTQLTLDTSDQNFPVVAFTDVDFKVVEPGMYLQYKEESVVSAPSTGNLTFADDDPDTITRASGDWTAEGLAVGDIVTVSGSTSNDGSYTVAEVTSTTVLTLVATDSLSAEVVTGGLGSGLNVIRTFKRSVQGVVYGFRWRLFGNDATLINTYQFVQHQLRQSTDIDYGPGISRGDVTDLLMSFATPTGTTLDMYIEDLSAVDINNVTWTDATGVARTEPFVSAGTISFNINLQQDAAAEYTMFFTNDDAGDDLGRDYGTPDAIIVKDASSVDIAGDVSAQASVSFSYDYNGNVQRGATSAGEDAPVTIVAIGLNTAQFVRLDGTIEQSKANNFSLVAALERNYSNP
jgi:hypothetical protein